MTTSPKVLRGANSRKVSTSLRLPVDEHLRVVKAARKAHLSVSDYIRRHLPETTVNFRLRRESQASA